MELQNIRGNFFLNNKSILSAVVFAKFGDKLTEFELRGVCDVNITSVKI